MPVQPQLFPEPVPDPVPASVPGSTSGAVSRTEPVAPLPLPAMASRQATAMDQTASGTLPVWMQRTSLFVLVLFCVYLGVLVMVLPWWPRMWDQNLFLLARPDLSRFLRIGAVRGIISGLGAIDVWIGLSEAIHYRETR